MQFKHPEILYALFLLLIPIIVHLFQLRRFKETPFTNVQFLKQVEQNTRNSSKLKKFLILCTRLLALAGLIFAFAQPFTSAVKKDTNRTTYIYLDNSMSMQAKGSKGELLKRAAQDIIETYQSAKNINLITNNKFLKNLSAQDLKKELLSIQYHPISQDINTALFKIKNNFEKNTNTTNEVVLISDFQNINELKTDSINSYNIVQTKPVKASNISLDSVFIANQNGENITLKVIAKNHNSAIESATISLFNGTVLQGKSTVELTKNGKNAVKFVIPSSDAFNGKLVLDDANLPFDNELFFSINKEDKINVIAVGNDNAFLKKIYTDDEFNFVDYKISQLDYSKLNEQNLIILNELERIPNTLTTNLKTYLQNGGKLVIIPSVQPDRSYASLFLNLGIGKINNLANNEVAITDINFSHPILKNVFEKQIKNFQYPTVKSYQNYNLKNSSPILKFENNTSFISEVKTQNSSVYIVSAAINKENSNFKNSPLIVPVFYNFAKQSYKHSELNYTIGNQNEIDVKAILAKDDILQIKNEEGSFIPLQQIGNSSVKINLDEQPLKNGFYQLKNKENTLKNLAFNYNRSESNLTYTDAKSLLTNAKNVSFYNNVKEALTTINNEYKTNNLWQIFLVAALLFLVVEVLILKFLKP